MAYKRQRDASPSNSAKRARAGLSYVSLGTELLDDKDDGEFVPVWKQTVTDDRGRRRLHGAFTGGFSAGYFNSVGSKEGWTPKTFVSSRSNRNKDQAAAPAQRPEDFMDEEDLAEAAEARQLEIAQNFAGIGGADDTGNDGFFGLFMSQEETMGVKLAQKMGWKRDQGIGRKISRAARTEDGSTSGKDAASYTFAPEDARAMPIPREEVRRQGLGYRSEARLGVVEEKPADRGSLLDFRLTESSRKPVVKKPTAKKSSFGMGVLNDTGSDDEDPYELGPKISFNKTIGKDKKAKKPSKFVKARAGEGPVFVSKKATSKALSLLGRASLDERPPLTGFVLAADIAELSSKPKYLPPKIPHGWKSSKSAASNTSAADYQSVADAAKASTLDAKGRSALLGEKQLPGKSIFDFISKDARDRLANLSGRTDLPQGRGESGPEGHLPAAKAQPKDLRSLVPPLDKSTAASALAKGATGWMPYAEDLQKRARYVGFLELRAGLKEDLPERIGNITTSDWVKELQEFAHAAQVFKPTTGIMASRFTSSSSSTLGGTAGASTDENLLRQPTKKPEDPAEEAAKMGMYGAMTRTSFPFHPSRLLCKRFNVRPPPDMPHSAESEGDGGFKAKTEEAVSKSAMDKMLHEVLTNGPALQRPAWMGQTPQDSVPAPAAQVTEHAIVDVEKNEALSNERAPEDVFKSIFGDDDDDDE